eukprot:scaffold115908_cov46-Attheya_sp.AAC.1
MMMGRISLVRPIIVRRMLLLAFALCWAGKSPATAQDVNIENFELEDVYGKHLVRHPVDMAWTPDGR